MTAARTDYLNSLKLNEAQNSILTAAAPDIADLFNSDDLNLKDKKSRTLLHYATLADNSALVEALLETQGVNPNPQDMDGQTPLIMAVKNENMVNLFLAVKPPINLNHKDTLGKTALHQAVFKGKTAVVQALLAAGSDVNCLDNKGLTPFHYAFCSRAAKEEVDKIKLLLLNTPEIKINLTDRDENKSVIHYACGAEENIELVFKLLDHATADLNLYDKKKLKPIHYAAINNRESVVLRLIQKGAEINLEQIPDVEAVSIAIQKHPEEILEFFKRYLQDYILNRPNKGKYKTVAGYFFGVSLKNKMAAAQFLLDNIHRLTEIRLIADFQTHIKSFANRSELGNLMLLIDQWTPVMQERLRQKVAAQMEGRPT